MNRNRTSRAKFAGFWCKNCGGRVFEEDPYRDSNGVKTAILKCTLCSHEAWCEWTRYLHLLKEIERAIIKTQDEDRKRKALFS